MSNISPFVFMPPTTIHYTSEQSFVYTRLVPILLGSYSTLYSLFYGSHIQ